MIERDLYNVVNKHISDKKAIIIVGARQVGKTTFVENILKDKDYLLIDCDDPINKEQIENANTESLKRIIGKKNIVFFDEAQRIKNIGLILKIIIDRIKNVKYLFQVLHPLICLIVLMNRLQAGSGSFCFFQ